MCVCVPLFSCTFVSFLAAAFISLDFIVAVCLDVCFVLSASSRANGESGRNNLVPTQLPQDICKLDIRVWVWHTLALV